MERRRCYACRGVYVPDQASGAYFHKCPPVANPDYQPDPARKGYDPRETIPRPFARDENVRPRAIRRKAKDGTDLPLPIVAEGCGFEELAEDDLPAPVARPSSLAQLARRHAAARYDGRRKARHK